MKLSTPEQAEGSFYRAFERADLSAMMAVWAEDEEVVCVHPGGERLVGFDAVRGSWRQLFSHGPRLRFQLGDLRVHTVRPMSIHNLYESITVNGEAGPAHLTLTTNVYLLTPQGWRMLVHHASPLPAGARMPETPAGTIH
jgi:ketosteroid isomerase-like protein